MRGEDKRSEILFRYVSCEARVPQDHPLRLIRAVVGEALDVLSGEFEDLYARLGRPGIAPEKLLQAFCSIRSERQLMAQLDYICCSAGSSAFRRTRRSGAPAPSARTASGFWQVTWRSGCWRRWSVSRGSGRGGVASTSPGSAADTSHACDDTR